MARRSYNQLLYSSFRLVFDNPRVFVPLIISYILGLLSMFLPFYRELLASAVTGMPISPSALGGIVVYSVFTMLMALFVYGWMFAMMHGLVARHHKDELRKAVMYALKLLAMALIFLVFLLLLFFGIGILSGLAGALTAVSSALGIALIIFSSVVMVFLMLFFIAYCLLSVAALIVENKGPVESMKKGMGSLRKRPGRGLALTGLVLLFSLISYFPYIIVFALMGRSAFMSLSLTSPLAYSVLNIALSIPFAIVYVWMLVFVSLSYKEG